MDTQQAPNIPNFTDGNAAGSSPASFTPLKKPGMSFSKKGIAAILSLAMLIMIPVVGYFVYTQNQTTKSEAGLVGPTCHNYVVPSGFTLHGGCYACNVGNKNYQNQFSRLPQVQKDAIVTHYFSTGSKTWILAKDIQREGLWGKLNCPDPDLRDPETGQNVLLASAWNVTQGQCTAPPQNKCKKKSPMAYECSPGGIILPCTSPTPTQPVKICAAPLQCLPAAECASDTSLVPSTGVSVTSSISKVTPTTTTGTIATPTTGNALGGTATPTLSSKLSTTPSASLGGSSGALATAPISGVCGLDQLCCMPKSTPTPTETPSPTPTIVPGCYTTVCNPDLGATACDKVGLPGMTCQAVGATFRCVKYTCTDQNSQDNPACWCNKPTPTLACVAPKLNVEVQCLTCGQ